MKSRLGFQKLMGCDLKPRQRAMRCLVLATLGLALLANCVEAAGLDQTGGTRQDNQWLQEHLLNDKAQLPFSFLYDRQGSSTLLKAWPKKTETKQLDSGRTQHIVSLG
jgi:hypothetical protein